MTEEIKVSEQNNVQVEPQEPFYPLSLSGVAFLLGLMENSANRGDFAIHSYAQVYELYNNALEFYRTHVPESAKQTGDGEGV